MSDFRERNVLITGAASGLGLLMAKRIAADGGHLILWDVNEAALAAAARELQDRGCTVATYVCNLADRDAIRATADALLARHGHVDILINNAGIVSGKPLLEISDDEIQRTFDVNTLALFWTTRAFLPKMKERNRGHIVTIASAAGIVGTARLTDYCSSKFAAVGFDDSLRLELDRLGLRIRTTVVCPFYISTGMFAGVKTRFPLLLPILDPDYAVGRIILAIRNDKRRLIMPSFVYAVYATRLLPVALFDALMRFFGVSKSMDQFTGRVGH
jgi:all-trans-retinol dehydrogenase (NAD+)